MTREQALPYISYCLDDAGGLHDEAEMPSNARLIGWQCGFEPLFIAVWSNLGDRLDDDEAEGLATDLLIEKNWFAHGETEPDYII